MTRLALAAALLVAACAAPTAPHGPVDDRPGVRGPATAETLTAPLCHVVDGRADRRCTPGALNPQVTQTSITQTICKPGWAQSIRPPSGYTTNLKHRQKPLYGENAMLDAQLEEDHLIPLSVGGAPTDPTNLFPQPWPDAKRKDVDENTAHRDVCAGRVTLKQAQDQLLAEWSHQ